MKHLAGTHVPLCGSLLEHVTDPIEYLGCSNPECDEIVDISDAYILDRFGVEKEIDK